MRALCLPWRVLLFGEFIGCELRDTTGWIPSPSLPYTYAAACVNILGCWGFIHMELPLVVMIEADFMDSVSLKAEQPHRLRLRISAHGLFWPTEIDFFS